VQKYPLGDQHCESWTEKLPNLHEITGGGGGTHPRGGDARVSTLFSRSFCNHIKSAEVCVEIDVYISGRGGWRGEREVLFGTVPRPMARHRPPPLSSPSLFCAPRASDGQTGRGRFGPALLEGKSARGQKGLMGRYRPTGERRRKERRRGAARGDFRSFGAPSTGYGAD
jgi:hypothetical protein